MKETKIPYEENSISQSVRLTNCFVAKMHEWASDDKVVQRADWISREILFFGDNQSDTYIRICMEILDLAIYVPWANPRSTSRPLGSPVVASLANMAENNGNDRWCSFAFCCCVNLSTETVSLIRDELRATAWRSVSTIPKCRPP